MLLGGRDAIHYHDCVDLHCTMVVSAAAAEAADLSYKVRPRARFAVAWSKLY